MPKSVASDMPLVRSAPRTCHTAPGWCCYNMPPAMATPTRVCNPNSARHDSYLAPFRDEECPEDDARSASARNCESASDPPLFVSDNPRRILREASCRSHAACAATGLAPPCPLAAGARIGRRAPGAAHVLHFQCREVREGGVRKFAVRRSDALRCENKRERGCGNLEIA